MSLLPKYKRNTAEKENPDKTAIAEEQKSQPKRREILELADCKNQDDIYAPAVHVIKEGPALSGDLEKEAVNFL